MFAWGADAPHALPTLGSQFGVVRSPFRAPLNTIALVLPREVSTDLSMLERLVDPRGRKMVDIGCGAGALARALAVAGARVVALEVSEEQLAPALASDGGSGVRYMVGRAQALPLEDAAVDIAVFMRTLHHVPVEDMTQALREARRVVRPGGTVYVAEPLSEGDFWALTSMVEDEFEARQAAQSALAQVLDIGLEPVNTVEYEVRRRLAGVDQFRKLTVAVDPSRAETFTAHSSELAEAFQRLGEPGERPGERCFLSPTRVNVLQGEQGLLKPTPGLEPGLALPPKSHRRAPHRTVHALARSRSAAAASPVMARICAADPPASPVIPPASAAPISTAPTR